jgi:hypothetical protein
MGKEDKKERGKKYERIKKYRALKAKKCRILT